MQIKEYNFNRLINLGKEYQLSSIVFKWVQSARLYSECVKETITLPKSKHSRRQTIVFQHSWQIPHPVADSIWPLRTVKN